MVRTPRVTIMRAASLAQYTRELDSLYENSEIMTTSESALLGIDPGDYESVLLYLRNALSRLTNLSFGDDDNFFVK
jgi:hypothetical protein